MSQELESIRTEMPGGHTFRYLPVSNINDTGFAEAIFTTREGGVSAGPYRSLDLGWNNDDSRDNIYENYRIAAMHFGAAPDRCVMSMQTHTTNVRRITEEDAGRGLTRPLGYRDIDGMCTDVPGIVLVTLHADCTPLYFADPVHKAVGLAHSGWRGTAGRMGACMVDRMQEWYGTRPEELLAFIGPTIRSCCYEIGPEVAAQFTELFGESVCQEEEILLPGRGDRMMLNLAGANRRILLDAGILPEHLGDSGICTCCHGDLFFSHRYAMRHSGGKRGNCAAMIMIRQNASL